MGIRLIFICLLFIPSNGLFRKYKFHENTDVLRLLKPEINLASEQTFLQRIDHFDPTNNSTWKQRYFVNKNYYKKGGPAYLLINGEWTASIRQMDTSYPWASHGQKNNAILFSHEHRYYGFSRPYTDTETANLRYLTTPQALADLAYFIQAMKKLYDLPEDMKWIVFGGSYAGSLAAWLRLKYPHLVHGAVASSAPLMAKVDFYEYFEVVRDSLSSYSKKCAADMKAANRRLDRMVRNKLGREKINKIFKLCDTLTNHKLDVSYFFENMADVFAYIVQYNKRNSIADISATCDLMLKNRTTSVVVRYANVVQTLLRKMGEECLATKYDKFLKQMKKTDWKSAQETMRPWFYQTCTEYGYYQTSSKIKDTFSRNFPVSFFIKMCTDIFGKKFDQEFVNAAANVTNTFFGGKQINVGNIVYAHGSIDPWHALGITTSDKMKLHEVIYMEGTSHCQDMALPDNNDSAVLQNGRNEILKTLDKLISAK